MFDFIGSCNFLFSILLSEVLVLVFLVDILGKFTENLGIHKVHKLVLRWPNLFIILVGNI